jgi:hypothetical protein
MVVGMIIDEIITNPHKFREAFLIQVTLSEVDKEYGAILNVLLYYIWRGIFETREALLKGKVQTDLGILCFASYKSFLPIIQNIRLGYPADVVILLRAMMERIALLGYLHTHPHIIPKYKSKKNNLQKDAMTWAKNQAVENWMSLYSILSNLAHARLEGTAGYMLDTNPIGEAFRNSMPRSAKQFPTLTDELLAGICYALFAIDQFASSALDSKENGIFPTDKRVIQYVDMADLLKFQNFLGQLIDKYK